MELGTVVVVPASIDPACRTHLAKDPRPDFSCTDPLFSPRMPILGNDLLQLWIDRVRTLGVHNLWLASDTHDWKSLRARFRELTRQGVEKVLVIKLKSYAEMDLVDLLRFHCEKRNPVTDAQDARGPLGVRLLSRCALDQNLDRNTEDQGTSCHDRATSSPYQFCGYTKRLLSSKERQDLVQDALTGACAMRPTGSQVRDQVWIAPNAILDSSVRIIGPAYIGPRTTVRAGATIGPISSIEHDCVVDCGTTVERSSILPRTYLAPGLLIQESLVNGNRLEHLTWQTVVDLAPAGLARRIPRSTSANRNDFAMRSSHGSTEWKTNLPAPAASVPHWMQVNL